MKHLFHYFPICLYFLSSNIYFTRSYHTCMQLCFHMLPFVTHIRSLLLSFDHLHMTLYELLLLLVSFIHFLDACFHSFINYFVQAVCIILTLKQTIFLSYAFIWHYSTLEQLIILLFRNRPILCNPFIKYDNFFVRMSHSFSLSTLISYLVLSVLNIFYILTFVFSSLPKDLLECKCGIHVELHLFLTQNSSFSKNVSLYLFCLCIKQFPYNFHAPDSSDIPQ